MLPCLLVTADHVIQMILTFAMTIRHHLHPIRAVQAHVINAFILFKCSINTWSLMCTKVRNHFQRTTKIVNSLQMAMLRN